jgi:hypothetical protein
VAIRFTAVTGSSQIDDVYIDPHMGDGEPIGAGPDGQPLFLDRMHVDRRWSRADVRCGTSACRFLVLAAAGGGHRSFV